MFEYWRPILNSKIIYYRAKILPTVSTVGFYRSILYLVNEASARVSLVPINVKLNVIFCSHERDARANITSVR